MTAGSSNETPGWTAGKPPESSPSDRRGVVRVLVADDDAGVRNAIANLISSQESLELVGLAADAEEAVRIGSRTHPDVALVDVNMPKGGGSRASRELRDLSPQTRVLALSGSADRDGVLQMLAAGAAGYMVKGASVDVVQAIMAASRGDGVIADEVAAGVIEELSDHLARRQERDESHRSKVRRIQEVIDERSFTTVFQPIFDLRAGTVAGVEALSRFSVDPSDTPDRWFNEAWSLGLGVDLELAAVAVALEAARKRPPELFLALNASPAVTTTSRFSELVSSQADAETLVVEVTEHAMVEDYGQLTRALDEVRRRGVRVAVDDAGAGYASLRHILQIRPDLIKLDVSLVSGIEHDRPKLALAAAMTSFAREMGTKVVAEGIETAAQLECLAALGVDYAQGYHLGRPTSTSPADIRSQPLSLST